MFTYYFRFMLQPIPEVRKNLTKKIQTADEKIKSINVSTKETFSDDILNFSVKFFFMSS